MLHEWHKCPLHPDCNAYVVIGDPENPKRRICYECWNNDERGTLEKLKEVRSQIK